MIRKKRVCCAIFLLIVLVVFFISKCTFSNSVSVEKVRDLQEISQNVESYTQGIDDGYIATLQEYEKHYFKPWRESKIEMPLAQAMWAYNIFTPKNSYGENLCHREQSFFDKMLENSNFSEYATLNKPALTLKNVNLRAFPTQRPLFRNPKQAGEGFPFDYLQNSTLGANKPILVSHYSKDRAWVFVESSFADGWVHSRDIVVMPKKYIEIYQRVKQGVLLKDGVAFHDEKNNFLFYSHIGMMLPLIDANATTTTLLAVTKYAINRPLFHKSQLPSDVAHAGILSFNQKNIDAIIQELKKMHYGWGGMYGQRDCSSTIRDFFAPFGVWLPRNSSQEAKIGKVISFKGMNDREKIAIIKKEGVAFKTLLYKQGHILLYVGVHNNKVIVFQNIWGVKTLKDGKSGRFIIGKAVFSTLEIGKNLHYYDNKASLLSHLKSMNILTQ